MIITLMQKSYGINVAGNKNGHEVSVIFDGEDAQSALQKLSAEIENGLGE